MPPNSEIEKLERRWRDNPKGTVFAPYAEVLRKNGDHLLARDVLRQGLEIHPDHIPGNIVLGRCCLDLGEDGPAEAAFSHVLELDAENVIALKALADITERQGRLAEADAWLSRLISVDPSNDEARDQYTRISTARDAAAAALSAEPARPSAPVERTVEIPRQVLERAAQADRAEAGGGFISDIEPPRVEPAAAAAPPSAGDSRDSQIPQGHVLDLDEAEPLPLLEAEPAAVEDLEPVDLDLPAMAGEIESQQLSGMEVEETFQPPPPEAAPPSIAERPFAIGHEEHRPIEIQAAESSEFQSPDASHELLDLAPGGKSEYQIPDASSDLLDLSPGKSEYQVPDASEDLRLSGTGSSEYQTPSHADDLLRSGRSEAAPEEPSPEPGTVEELAEPRSAWGGGLSRDLAELAAMPTEEMASPPPVPSSLLRPAEADAPPSWLFDDESPAPETAAEPEAAAMEPQAAAPAEPPVAETEPAELIEPEPVAAAEEFEPAAEVPEPGAPEAGLEVEAGAAGRSTAELRLIFPDDAPEPEPHRMRRITEEAAVVAEDTEPVELAEGSGGEPEPVLTESMAELYAEQGHTAEALRVYRILAERTPHDTRLRERIRVLETRGAGQVRRMTYVAMDTGGESVESFFRSLALARPGEPGEVPPPPAGDAGGAPTRPARDPLSLSAIFGEEPAQRNPARTEAPPAPPPAPGPDAFSFDQFFGGAGGGNAHPAGPGRPSGASEEDLDQFQHWLKSLKK